MPHVRPPHALGLEATQLHYFFILHNSFIFRTRAARGLIAVVAEPA